MKTINKKKGTAMLITAAILTLVMLFAGCKHKTESKKSEPKYTITFGVDGTNGTLKAEVDGNEINTGDSVQDGKTVTFTATPSPGYKVKEWKVGNDVVTGNTSNTYTCTVTKAITVKVSFLAGEASYKVKHYKEKEEGGYPAEPTETEDKSGAVGTNAAYTPKTGGAYEGFTYKSDLTKINGSLQTSGMINGDGSTVVELFYERNTVSVTFGVDGSNGTLKAKADGVAETDASPISVQKGKTVTFTATPSSGYKVKEWKVGNDVVTDNTSNTYTCTVTKAVHITVSFAPPDVGSFEDAGDFIKIIPPANGIAGVAPGCTLPGNEAYWKGVFIDGRKVKLNPYKLGKTEVTYKLWKEVYDEAIGKGYVFANAGKKGSSGSGTDDEPVTMVSWRDCIVWCNAYTQIKLGSDEQCVYRKSKTDATVLKDARDGACDAAYADMGKKGFRLPTEAEWEYAARWQGSNNTNAVQYGDVWLTKLNSASGAKKPIGFSGLALPAGETWETLRDELTRVAVYDEWWNGSNWVDQPTAVTKTAAVKSKDANALGLYDMSGNVWEWCFDWYGDIEANTVTDPQGGASGPGRVHRGGSWSNVAKDYVVGLRGDYGTVSLGDNLGFRLGCLP